MSKSINESIVKLLFGNRSIDKQKIHQWKKNHRLIVSDLSDTIPISIFHRFFVFSYRFGERKTIINRLTLTFPVKQTNRHLKKVAFYSDQRECAISIVCWLVGHSPSVNCSTIQEHTYKITTINEDGSAYIVTRYHSDEWYNNNV